MTVEPVSPLRRRMIDDMSIRQFSPSTQNNYVRAVRDFAAFLGRSPDLAGSEDLRRYRVHTASVGASPAQMNMAVSALRFFFKTTLGRGDFGDHLATVRTPRTTAGRAQPGGSGAIASLRAGSQAQGRAQRRLWRRPSSLGDRPPEGRRHRQRPHADPGRAG